MFQSLVLFLTMTLLQNEFKFCTVHKKYEVRLADSETFMSFILFRFTSILANEELRYLYNISNLNLWNIFATILIFTSWIHASTWHYFGTIRMQDSQWNVGVYGGSILPGEKYATHLHFIFSLYLPHSLSSKSLVMTSQLSISSSQPSPEQVWLDTSNVFG